MRTLDGGRWSWWSGFRGLSETSQRAEQHN
jgi:hypothetical protein